MFAMPAWMQRGSGSGGFVARPTPGNELNEIVVHIAVGWVCSVEFQPVARWWRQYTRLTGGGGDGGGAFGSAFSTDSDAAEDNELLYGEVTVEGTAILLTEIGLGSDDTLYDLGSGAGRLVVQAALMSGGRAVGAFGFFFFLLFSSFSTFSFFLPLFPPPTFSSPSTSSSRGLLSSAGGLRWDRVIGPGSLCRRRHPTHAGRRRQHVLGTTTVGFSLCRCTK